MKNFGSSETYIQLQSNLIIEPLFRKIRISFQRIMYKVCSLRLGPNFGIRPAAGKNFSLWLTFEKMRAFAVFNDKYLRPWGSRSTISMTEVNCKNRKTKIKSKIIKTATSLFAITF